MQLKFYRSTCSTTTTTSLRQITTCCGGLHHLRSTLWYHKTRLHIQIHTYPRDATSVADVAGPIGTCSFKLQFQLFRHYYHVSHTRSTHWYPRQGFSIQTPPLSGRNQCRRRGLGPIRHMQPQILPFQLFRSHHYTAVVDWHLQIHSSGTIRQGFHIQTTHTYPRDASKLHAPNSNSAHAAQILLFQLFRHHQHKAAVGLALQIHPLVP
jgi:hypothetical protein